MFGMYPHFVAGLQAEGLQFCGAGIALLANSDEQAFLASRDVGIFIAGNRGVAIKKFDFAQARDACCYRRSFGIGL